MPRFVQKTATIAVGESLSSAIDCGTGAPVLVHIPADWTAARLTFQTSPDNVTFYDLFDRNAVEIAFNVVAGTSILLDIGWAPVLYFKIRSGGRDLGVPQKAARDLIVTLDTSAAVV